LGNLKEWCSEVESNPMARDLRKVFREAFELPESERATLAGLLIESIEAPPDPDVEEQWAIEAERRWRQIEAGEVETIPWEGVRAKLFRRG
jgi:putative addiction module component (TIGR02574 family)